MRPGSETPRPDASPAAGPSPLVSGGPAVRQTLFGADHDDDGLRFAWQVLLRGSAIFRRRWPVALVITVLGCLAVGIRLWTAPPKFVSEGLVQVGMHSDVFGDEAGVSWYTADMVGRTHRKLLTSDKVVETAMRTLGLEIPASEGRREAFQAWLGPMQIEPVEDTFLVSVKTAGTDPRAVTDRVNALMDAFVPFSNEFVGTRYVVKQRQLTDREHTMRESLREASTRLAKLYEERGRIDFDDRRTALTTAQHDLGKKLTAIQIELATVEAEQERLATSLESGDETLERLAGRLQDDDLSERLKPLADLRAKVLRLGTALHADHPEHVAAQAELEAEEAALRETLREAARVVLERHKQRRQVMASEIEKLGALLAAKDQALLELDKLEGVYSAVQRDVDFYDKELETVRGQLARVEGRSQVEMAAQIVNRAEIPAGPVSRFSPLVVMLTVFLNALLGLGTIVVWDHLEDTVSSEDAARLLGLPVLGRVPVVDLKKTSELQMLRDSSHSSRTAEAFRLLRTNLTFAAAGLKGSAVLVTSGTASDGKSISSTQLALALARIGDGKVLLIEGDMRKPRLQQILETFYEVGLSDLLAGLARLEDVCHPTEFENLHFLASGPQPPNAADLLVQGHFETLIQDALKVFDYVVVDSPPVVGIADTSMMAPHVKGVLFVLKLHHSRRRSASHAIEQVEAVGGRPLGLLLNGVSRLDAGYGYGSAYSGYYGHGGRQESQSKVAAAPPAQDPG